MTQLVLPGMRKQRWGRIINISSMGGKLVFPGGGFYHATKWAVEAISDALRFEVRAVRHRCRRHRARRHRDRLRRDVYRARWPAAAKVRPTPPSTATASSASPATYQGKVAGPEVVAKVIEHAITSKHPRTRYPITSQARTVMALRRVLPDRAWDRFIGTQFKHDAPDNK